MFVYLMVETGLELQLPTSKVQLNATFTGQYRGERPSLNKFIYIEIFNCEMFPSCTIEAYEYITLNLVVCLGLLGSLYKLKQRQIKIHV